MGVTSTGKQSSVYSMYIFLGSKNPTQLRHIGFSGNLPKLCCRDKFGNKNCVFFTKESTIPSNSVGQGRSSGCLMFLVKRSRINKMDTCMVEIFWSKKMLKFVHQNKENLCSVYEKNSKTVQAILGFQHFQDSPSSPCELRRFFQSAPKKAIQIQCFNILKYAEKEKSLNRFVQR